MKAVIAEMPKHWMRERTNSERGQRDEVWEGVLHVPPIANGTHQDFSLDLGMYIKRHWAKPTGGLVRCGVNLTTPEDEDDWTHNYRIPDVVLLDKDRLHVDKNEYMVGAPLVVVEIRSPGDESYEKLPFYAGLGVPEVWIFLRDSKKLELYTLDASGKYAIAAVQPDGWLRSPATGIAFHHVVPGTITLRVNGDPATDEELPS